MEGCILYECWHCDGIGRIWESYGGPFGKTLPCNKCNGEGKLYVKLEFAKEQLEASKEDLFELLEKILKLEKDIQDVESN